MTQVLTDIKSVGGVVGCFLYDNKGGVVASDAPTLFKPAKLAEVGRALAKTMKAGAMALPDSTDISLYFEEILIVSREIRRGTLLVVLCDPAMNVNLLSMSINLAMEELCELAERGGPQPVQAAPSVQPAPAVQAAPSVQPAPAVQASPSVQPQPAAPMAASAPGGTRLGEESVKALEAALAKIVGPMASIIFKDCFDAWNGKGGGNVPALLAELRREIGDEEKGARFAALAEQALLRAEGRHG